LQGPLYEIWRYDFFTYGYIDENKNYIYGSINEICTNEGFGIHAGMSIDEC